MGLHDKSLIEPVERIIVSINLTDVLGGSYNPLFVDKCVFGDPSGMLKQVHDGFRRFRNKHSLSFHRACPEMPLFRVIPDLIRDLGL